MCQRWCLIKAIWCAHQLEFIFVLFGQTAAAANLAIHQKVGSVQFARIKSEVVYVSSVIRLHENCRRELHTSGQLRYKLFVTIIRCAIPKFLFFFSGFAEDFPNFQTAAMAPIASRFYGAP